MGQILFVYSRCNKEIKVMLKLSISDKFDGSNKIGELRDAIGNVFSDNFSTTLNSRLVSVSEDGNSCITEEAPSEYNNIKPKAGTKSTPSWLTWNAMFY